MSENASKNKATLAAVERRIEMLKVKYEACAQPSEAHLRKQYEKALYGIELGNLEREAAELQEKVLEMEKPKLKKTEYRHRRSNITHRKLSAGDTLWYHRKKQARIEGPESFNILDPGSDAAKVVGQTILALHRSLDGVTTVNKRPKNWREDTEIYYNASRKDGMTWCHAMGTSVHRSSVKAAHIVPFFMRGQEIGAELFGSRGDELQTSSNALLFHNQIKSWFDRYCFVVVPADYNEVPITRWKIELVGNTIRNQHWGIEKEPGTFYYGRDLDGKELKFLGNARPASRFLYFQFMMTLVRIRDLKAPGWEEIWTKYFTTPPFLTPGSYVRRSMLISLNQTYKTTDAKIIEKWIQGQGYEEPVFLSDEESERVKKRVLLAIEEAEEEESYSSSEEESDSEEGGESGSEEEDGESDSEESEDESEGSGKEEYTEERNGFTPQRRRPTLKRSASI